MSMEDSSLDSLKKRMSPGQKRQMAELLERELRARQASKAERRDLSPRTPTRKSAVASSRISTALSPEELQDVYSSLRAKVRQGVNQRKGRYLNALQQGLHFLSGKTLIFILLILGLGTLKIMLGTGMVRANNPPLVVASPASAEPSLRSEVPLAAKEQGGGESDKPSEGNASAVDRRLVGWSETEKEVLTKLDQRRVDLEKRKVALDDRETELNALESNVSEKIAELRTLSRRLEEVKREKSQTQDARLEQLANVYGSMAPNEAAPLIAKLDSDIALALLERMPNKRMGQILGMMEAERAIELTKRLTSKDGK